MRTSDIGRFGTNSRRTCIYPNRFLLRPHLRPRLSNVFIGVYSSAKANLVPGRADSQRPYATRTLSPFPSTKDTAMILNGTISESRHLIFVVVSLHVTFSPPPPYPGVRSTVLSLPTRSEKIRHHLNRLILHGGVQVRHRWYPPAPTCTNRSHANRGEAEGTRRRADARRHCRRGR